MFHVYAQSYCKNYEKQIKICKRFLTTTEHKKKNVCFHNNSVFNRRHTETGVENDFFNHVFIILKIIFVLFCLQIKIKQRERSVYDKTVLYTHRPIYIVRAKTTTNH